MTRGTRVAAAAFALGISLFSAPIMAEESISLYAAGSLRAVMLEIGAAFTRETGVKVVPVFGASGLLRDQIAGGKQADVFASANMEHPQSLAAQGKAQDVRRFARNRLCALVAPGIAVESSSLLDHMLDDSVKVGTSTPRADPAGDYAFEFFAKADAIRPGARAKLEAKALQLTGGPNSPPPPADRSVYGVVIAEGKADIFLTYCTNAEAARQENPGQRVVAVPTELAVGADYGIATIAGAKAPAGQFVQFVLGPAGQRTLARYGFSPP